MLNFLKNEKWLIFYRFFFVTISFLSISLIVFSYSSLNDTSVSILNGDNVHIEPAGGRRSEVSLTRHLPSDISVTCNYKKIQPHAVCGALFFFPLNLDINQFVSFDQISNIKADIVATHDSDDQPPRIRIMIRSLLDDDKWLTYHESDVKYHAVRLEGNGKRVIPLDRFTVETWWLERYQVPYEQSFVDYSKVVNIDVYINDIPLLKPGKYTIKIRQLEAIGHYLERKTLYTFLALFWPASIVFFLLHHTLVRYYQIKRLTEQAFFDSELGVLNLRGFDAQVREFHGRPGSVYLIKIVNLHLLEKHFGEPVLTKIMADTLTRVSGLLSHMKHCIAHSYKDEIVIFVGDEPLKTRMELNMIELFTQGIVVEGAGHLRLEVKVGVSRSDTLHEASGVLLEQCRQATKFIGSSHNVVQEYNTTIRETLEQEAVIEASLREAIQHELFDLTFMPIYSAELERMVGAEALIQCTRNGLKGLSPEVYIPLAEKTGLIREIDFWVIKRCLCLLSNTDALPDDFVLSINLSSRELLDASFVKNFQQLLMDYQIEATKICLEVTETFFIEMDKIAINSIRELRALGCLISLDDFGTGYTSYSHLLHLPIDEIKIDKSFIDSLYNKEYKVMVDSIIDIAHCHGYEIVAEGIEKREQFDYLKGRGCQLYQGYMISRPVSFEALLEQIKAGK